MNSNSLSLNEIAYNVLNALRGGRSSNNDYLSTDQIKYIIKYWRARLIRQDQERNFNRYTMFEQNLGNVEFEEASLDENFDLYRTKMIIPSPVRLKDGEAITHVSVEGKTIPVIDEHRLEWEGYTKYISKRDKAYYQDGYIYIQSLEYIDSANIRGIFEDPEKVFDFVNAQEGTFAIYDDNSPFPMPMDMVDQIMSGILNGTLKMLVTTPNDTTTDTLQGA